MGRPRKNKKESQQLKDFFIALYPQPIGLVVGNKALIDFLDKFLKIGKA